MPVHTAEQRVLGWQTKLHRWAVQDEQQRFGDLFNLVCDPATLLVAWERVKRNRGSRTAGVDGQTRKQVEQMGVDGALAALREELKAGTYRPLPARERLIPKRSGKLRSLGISTVRDRIVQTAAKLVLEPIFEAGSARPRTDSGPGAELRTPSNRCGSSCTPLGRMSG
jgi:RNA-directed DNA polymerase